jgi:hypothetical protein
MKTLGYFRTVRRELWVMLTIAVGVYFGVDEAGDEYVPERLARFLSMLSASSIAAFVFYFVDVHIRNEKEAQIGMSYALPFFTSIIGEYISFLEPVFARTTPLTKVYDTKIYAWKGFHAAVVAVHGEDGSTKQIQAVSTLHGRVQDPINHLLLANITIPGELHRILAQLAGHFATGNNNLSNGGVKDDFLMYKALVDDYRLLYVALAREVLPRLSKAERLSKTMGLRAIPTDAMRAVTMAQVLHAEGAQWMADHRRLAQVLSLLKRLNYRRPWT